MIEEHDSVALTRDLPEHSLECGDIGTVVYRYDDGEAFEVEFLAGDGSTLAVLRLEAVEVRPRPVGGKARGEGGAPGARRADRSLRTKRLTVA